MSVKVNKVELRELSREHAFLVEQFLMFAKYLDIIQNTEDESIGEKPNPITEDVITAIKERLDETEFETLILFIDDLLGKEFLSYITKEEEEEEK